MMQMHVATCYLHTPTRLQTQRLRRHAQTPRTWCCAQSAAQADEALRSKRHITVEDLQDPAHIGGSAKSEVAVQDFGNDLSLEAYMQLPVEQYYELDPAMIRPLGGKRFALQVPRVNLFNVWVEPLVEVVVHLSNDRDAVIIEAKNCRLSGSPLIENLHLDQRFCLSFVTTLTWSSAVTSGQDGNGASTLQSPEQSGKGHIQGDARLDVWSEVVQPFHLMPRFALEGTSNAVMGALVGNLLPRFMDRLGNDYKRWATDPAYREARKSAAKHESVAR
ncbi:TPA: hypothetical protein ACH3X2_001461 [Trebouxia sp. C0005]